MPTPKDDVDSSRVTAAEPDLKNRFKRPDSWNDTAVPAAAIWSSEGGKTPVTQATVDRLEAAYHTVMDCIHWRQSREGNDFWCLVYGALQDAKSAAAKIVADRKAERKRLDDLHPPRMVATSGVAVSPASTSTGLLRLEMGSVTRDLNVADARRLIGVLTIHADAAEAEGHATDRTPGQAAAPGTRHGHHTWIGSRA